MEIVFKEWLTEASSQLEIYLGNFWDYWDALSLQDKYVYSVAVVSVLLFFWIWNRANHWRNLYRLTSKDLSLVCVAKLKPPGLEKLEEQLNQVDQSYSWDYDAEESTDKVLNLIEKLNDEHRLTIRDVFNENRSTFNAVLNQHKEELADLHEHIENLINKLD